MRKDVFGAPALSGNKRSEITKIGGTKSVQFFAQTGGGRRAVNWRYKNMAIDWRGGEKLCKGIADR